jgi:hypothetical protein
VIGAVLAEKQQDELAGTLAGRRSGRLDFDAELRRFRGTLTATVDDMDFEADWHGVRGDKAAPPPRP